MNRAADLVLALALAMVLIVPIAIISGFVAATSRGPILFWSQRIGQGGKPFAMPKFRTMRTGTPVVATHLLQDARQALTPIGGFLRSTSLDELPQLWSILRGDMGFVGPRPALFNQDDLMELRRAAGVDLLRPGLTGWAQINGRDELSIEEKVKFESEYLRRKGMLFDLKIIFLTALRALGRKGVSH
ncbi:sugar transferase [Qipengyuania sp. MTN3-11]|uniref:sugar transferase n=1 Tax=Qipengyuania sp. MTN3-11 TaxID=3056557 RepID=UPI0036F1F6EB